MEEYPLNQISTASQIVREGKSIGTFVADLANVERVEVDKIPVEQLNKVDRQLLAGLSQGNGTAVQG